MKRLHEELDALIAASGAEVAIALETLDGKDSLFINADTVFHAASTMKMGVMLELFRQVANGDVQLTDTTPVVNEFASIMDGSPYHLDIEYDQESTLYHTPTHTLGELCHLMITISSNLATNVLIEKLGRAQIQATLDSFELQGLQVRRGIQDIKAFDAGVSNTTTARALTDLLLLIARHKCISPAACDAMLMILKQQQFRTGIPARLPAHIEVANKTGEITLHRHDAGVIYGARPFALAVLTRGLEDGEQSLAIIADVAQHAYAALNP